MKSLRRKYRAVTIPRVRRLMNVLLAVAGVAVVAGAVYVISTNHAPGKSGHRSAGGPTASRSKDDPPSSQPTKKPKSPVVAFLGDDWTAGVGASGIKHRFTTLVSHDLHVTERNFGANGTGYAKETSSDGDYTSRVADVVAAHPDVVVVSGGRNDANNLLATVASRARSLFDELHSKLPDATLVAVAPLWGDSNKPPEVVAIGQAVKSAVTAAGGKYLDIADPIHGHKGFMADAGDPDDDGYAAIAAALEPKLTALLPK
jgi:lysophospholipase L1-like esterase